MDAPSGLESLTAEQKAQAMMQLETLVQGQKVVMKILGKCFSKCVDSPGNELNMRQQQCIYSCTHMMFETEQYINRRLDGLAKAQQQQQG
ncbi:unnamed protein product [Vitrella brassicaformis CCMP3155]|uniref:Mitochondrial import inner membrane translocase subunit n=1 Tax=Vitrella brassicaformis (strain CCMP3155) TaxID=1169540 RepID=A0A0G4EVS1_VITBC|nr:unnamed protein product [Vitrella brassicaformis CCMP3155]|mmetsp:Transcript_41362/g.103234  ORF Transcript_41362/g.103234 Transcript_41362/m.103234 type:complete len:90 (+) Transcript_41362:146-415(+)|eukprot:CEM02404.1 unnamed protein product [Vitrella brassicaformis CCMP3155]